MDRGYGLDASMSSFEHHFNIVQNTINAACGEGRCDNQNFSNLVGWNEPFDYQIDRSRFVWREPVAYDITAISNGPFEFQADRLDYNRDVYNSGLTNYSSYALNNHGLMPQPYPRSYSFPSFDDFQSSTQMSSIESRFEDFKVNQIKKNEELLEELKSLSSSVKMLKTIIAQQAPSSYRPENEQNNILTLCNDCEFESSSFQKTEIWLETNEIESIQVENREVQEEFDEPKYIPPPPYIPQVPFPQRLCRAEIVKSNELELKDPPIEYMNEQLEEKEDGDLILKVDASDNTNEKFNQFDLSTLRRCLEKFDVIENHKVQIKYHIQFEPRKMTSKEEYTKHVLRHSFKHFWKNYDALRGRKSKIR